MGIFASIKMVWTSLCSNQISSILTMLKSMVSKESSTRLKKGEEMTHVKRFWFPNTGLLIGIIMYAAASMREASGHSFLLSPTPDWINYAQPECRRGGTAGAVSENCYGPCGTEQYFFDPNRQATTFSRGQTVSMQWGKNNHFNGFVRFTLVPKSQRMDFGSHDRFAFRYACWEAGSTACSPGEFCGTDLQGIKYTANVQIPAVYPDGDYVLGWSWYGGTRYFSSDEMSRFGISSPGGHRSEYGDYFSCANIRIQGGAPVESSYTPVFETGQADRAGTCSSAVSALGVCPVEPCSPQYPAVDMVPEPFNGKSPSPILASYLGYVVDGSSSSSSPPPPAADASQTPSPTSSASRPSSSSSSSSSSSVSISGLSFINTGDQSVFYSAACDNSASSNSIHLQVKGLAQTLSIRADTTGPVSRVHFVAQLSNDHRTLTDHTEYTPPYFIQGDENGNGIANPWQAAALDNGMTVSVTAVSSDGSETSKQFSLYLDTKSEH
jgi:hypothetical protein